MSEHGRQIRVRSESVGLLVAGLALSVLIGLAILSWLGRLA